MTAEQKLEAIRAAVQIDPGCRGLARDPNSNLFTACRQDFVAACHWLHQHGWPPRWIGMTGFPIVLATPPCFETDGPLGLFFLLRAFGISAKTVHDHVLAEAPVRRAIEAAMSVCPLYTSPSEEPSEPQFLLAIERAGPGHDGICRTMRGAELNPLLDPAINQRFIECRKPTIAIGDGGNELGMGKIPHQTVVKNVPQGEQIHCRVPADYLIVVGVSNWGAYALAAGLFVLNKQQPPASLFDPELERSILDVMVREGPLVDGLTGKPTATVDGLSWEDYIAPFNKIREILAC